MLALLFFMSTIAVAHFRFRAQGLDLQHPSVAYRAENVLFSWNIAVKHPIFGIGLWAPREQYLEDYQMTYPYVSKDVFKQWVMSFRTSENNLLTFLTDLGFPFVIIYCGALIAIIRRLVRMAFNPPAECVPHPLALLLPITGAVLHFQIFDGLFQPQISWFFHVLLGMVFVQEAVTVPRVALDLNRAFFARIILVIAAIILGVLMAMVLPREGPIQLMHSLRLR
jgi:hypothetical protein